MDMLTHLLGLSLIAAIIAGLGVGLAFLNALALRLRLTGWAQPWPALVAVALPALLWAGLSLYLLALMAADPTAANLWPLTLGLMAVLWLGWIILSGLVAALVRLARRFA